ncbi:Mov34/MPN/PAD-1 family protein [Paenibacillus aurantiacus]|uniref:Mov34/MPN/PAD-1 family protein n=1 Tax=Paenibacillus aurantiacus TaxID=1936118 RepID=A0ABV5KSH0_9BACL
MFDSPLKEDIAPLHRIVIHTQTYDHMLDYAKDRLPNEACGVLAGSMLEEHGEAIIRISAMYPIANDAMNPARAFAFNPEAWVNAYYQMQKNRQSLVGFFHSHPTAPPSMSQADLAGLRHSGAETYWILSFEQSGPPSVCVYRQRHGCWTASMFAQVCV